MSTLVPPASAALSFAHTIERLDDLDRRIIVALQQDGRASWTTVADSVGSPVATIARRGQQLIANGVVRVAAMPELGSDGPVDLFFVRINCAPGTAVDVAAELAAHDDTRFVSLVTGEYDIMAELAVRGGSGNFASLISSLQSVPGVERWRSDPVLHVYKVAHDWGRQLLAESRGEHEPHSHSEPVACEPAHFDDVDRAIIAEMQGDGRVTFASLGERVGVNESSARRRLDRMRQSGCVSVVTLFSAAALGFGAETLITLQIEPSRLVSVAQELAEQSAVRYIAAILDANSLMCEIIAPSTDDLYRFMTSTVGSLQGVRGWEAAMELLSLKRGFVETPWWRSQATG